MLPNELILQEVSHLFPAITGLNGGSTYTFIVYSIGTQTGLPAITFASVIKPLLQQQ